MNKIEKSTKYFKRIYLDDNSKHTIFIKNIPDNIISEDEKIIYIRTINWIVKGHWDKIVNSEED